MVVKDAGIGAKGVESRTFRGAEVWFLREGGGEFGVGNVGKDVGKCNIEQGCQGGSGELGKTGVVIGGEGD